MAVASTGPYANHLHLNPDRSPCQYFTTQFVQAGCPSCRAANSVKALKAVHESIKCAQIVSISNPLFRKQFLLLNKKLSLVYAVQIFGMRQGIIRIKYELSPQVAFFRITLAHFTCIFEPPLSVLRTAIKILTDGREKLQVMATVMRIRIRFFELQGRWYRKGRM